MCSKHSNYDIEIEYEKIKQKGKHSIKPDTKQLQKKKKPKVNTRKLSVGAKLFLTSTFTGIVACLILAAASYHLISTFLLSQNQEHSLVLAKIAASSIDGDLHDSLQPGDEDSEAYNSMLQTLNHLFADEQIQYIYTMKESETGELQFVLDLDTSEDKAKIGDTYEWTNIARTCLTGKAVTEKSVLSDQWGSYYTSCAPIYNSNGAVVGLVGIDIADTTIQQEMMLLIKSVLILCAAFLFLRSFTDYISAKKISRNLLRVNDKILDVISTDGDLTKKLTLHSGDELEIIANNINLLIEKIRLSLTKVKEETTEIYYSTSTIKTNMTESNNYINNVVLSMNGISDSTDEIGKSLEELTLFSTNITNYVEDINKGTTTGVSFTTDMTNHSQQIQDTASTFKESLLQSIGQMNNKLAEQIKRAEIVKEINRLTEQILNISDETALLALNANIEAARAGTNGNGFAVVARQVGILANDSAIAAKEIKGVIDSVILEVQGLSDTSQELIQFTQQKVLETYEIINQMSNQYAVDTEEIQKLFQTFYSITSVLSTDTILLNGSIETITASIEESISSLSNIASCTSELKSQLESISDRTNNLSTTVDTLKEEMNHYTL